MEQLIDMHTHTNYSDGELTPSELVELAIDKGITTLAITDHDTIQGIKKFKKEEYDKYKDKIRVINGIELSNKIDHGRLHILGYDIDLDSDILNGKMSLLKDNSTNSLLSIYEQVKKDYKIRFSHEEIKELINSNHNLGRPDLAKLLMKHGYAVSVQDAFDKYLIDAFQKVRGEAKGLYYDESIDLILLSGGIPVLAHPKSLKLNDKELRVFLEKLIACGLQGLEVYHSSHTKEEMEYYLYLANQYNLLVSGGSDYHGKIVKPDVELGTGVNNNLKIRQLSILNRINK